MPTISEEQLASWTQPAFGNEEEKAGNTQRMIGDAISRHAFLHTLAPSVYAKGSYKNNTNVRRDSDVDVAVEYTGIIFPTYADDADPAHMDRVAGLSPHSGPLIDESGETNIQRFKDGIEQALVSSFGRAAVTRHNKVLTVRESTRSLAADVIPCATQIHYWSPTNLARGI